MSLYAADAFGYLQQVEAYFLSHSRIGVMLSSKDTELMRHFRDSGVPVEVMCLGVKRAFEQFEEPPRSVYQCRRAIEHEIRFWRRSAVGTHERVDEGRVEPAPRRANLPGRDLPDPTDPRRRRRRDALRRSPAASATVVTTTTTTTTRSGDGETTHVGQTVETEGSLAEDEPHLIAWHRSMERLIELGRSSKDEHIRRCYRWAYREMQTLKTEAMSNEDTERVSALMPLAVGRIEAAMYDQLFNSLHPDLRANLEARLPPQMDRALRAMSPPAAHRQLRVWRRRLLEEMMSLAPFFTP